MTTIMLNSTSSSNLVLPVKCMGDVKCPRIALGDITAVQINKNLLVGKKKTGVQCNRDHVVDKNKRVTRRTCKISDICIEEPMDVVQEEVLCERVLPPGVLDIDLKDAGNPQLCSEYVTETFAYLRTIEDQARVKVNHLSGLPTDDKMRAVLVDWLVEVQTQFKLLQETLHSTVNIVDRYMDLEGKTVSRAKLQLIGVSAMFLASKIEETYAPACSDFVYITDNAYSEVEIKATEMKIVKALQFNLSQPVSLNFLRRISKAGDVDILQHSLAKYSLEVCLLDHSLVPVPGSQLASASLCLSLLVLEPIANNMNNVWTPTLNFYSGYEMSELIPVIKKIATNIVKTARSNNKLQAVRTKYKSSKFLKVSELVELKGDIMMKLVNL